MRFAQTPFPRPSAAIVGAAFIYLSGSAWMLSYTLTDEPRTLLWLAVVASRRRSPMRSRRGTVRGRSRMEASGERAEAFGVGEDDVARLRSE